MAERDTWMVVRPDNRLPGGLRVVHAQLSESQARRYAEGYKRPHEAMTTSELYERRMAAMRLPRA